MALSASVRAQQASDDCSNAPLLVFNLPNGISVTGVTYNATVDGSCSCAPGPAQPDVWFRFVPTVDGRLRAYTATSGTDWLLSIHSACPGTIANEIACNDNSPFGTQGGARVEANVLAGHTYWIRVAGAHSSVGVFYLYVDFPTNTWPLHDDPSQPLAIAPGVHPDDSFAADTSDPLVCVSWGALWYSYVPSQSGLVTADTCTQSMGSNALTDTYINVYEGTTVLACADDSCMYHASATFSATAGHTYLIRAGDFWGGGGEYVLTLSGPPAGQETCSALPLLREGPQLLSLVGAIANGSSTCDAGTAPDFAYEFVAPTDGALEVTTCGTSDAYVIDRGEDTVLSIHSACPPTAANTIACNDNASPPCPLDALAVEDASVDALLVAGQRVVVRVTLAGAPTSNQPILLTATFRPGISFCAGDGSGTACPCANFGAPDHGCAHSSSVAGGLLSASGTPSVASDTLSLEASSLPASGTGLYVQGSALVANGAGAPFGDGLRCVGGSVIRLAVRVFTQGASSFGHGDGTSASIAVRGLVPPSGALRHYQFWFRDAASFCTSSSFNLSNALSVQWVP